MTQAPDITGPEPLPRGGANQSGGRAYNERLVLSLIRRRGALPKAELARMTGLAPQTLTMIVNRFEADGLVVREERRRGRVGQPSVPYALNPEGAFSVGLKIGRRSVEIALVDFVGAIRRREQLDYAYPTPAAGLEFAREQVRRIRRSLSPARRARLHGIGVALPSQVWEWEEEVDAPTGVLEEWRRTDVRQAVEHATGLPALVLNDATAACGAELARSAATQASDFVYLFVGWFIGGGIVLDGALRAGPSLNAGALGSMPVWSAKGPVQLLRVASLHGLEQRLREHGLDPSPIWDAGAEWPDYAGPLDDWLEEAANGIAQAIAGVCAVVDVPVVVLDGAMPESVRDRLVAEVCYAFAAVDRRGLSPVQIRAGAVGADARLLGAAMLPMLAEFAPTSEVIFKATAPH